MLLINKLLRRFSEDFFKVKAQRYIKIELALINLTEKLLGLKPYPYRLTFICFGFINILLYYLLVAFKVFEAQNKWV